MFSSESSKFSVMLFSKTLLEASSETKDSLFEIIMNSDVIMQYQFSFRVHSADDYCLKILLL